MEPSWAGCGAFLLTLLAASSAQLTSSPPAEILSADGTSSLEFAVGSNVTLLCRLDLSKANASDVNTMSLYRGSTSQPLNVTVVGNDSIETTLLNVTFNPREVIHCRSGSGKTLATQSLCIGYAPAADFNVSCRLYPHDHLECCVLTDQPQDSLCNVHWTMNYRRRDEDHWEAFSDVETQCASLPESAKIFYYEEATVRATSLSEIGTASAFFTFMPAQYTEPLQVENLSVNTNSADCQSILVTWHHNQDLNDVLCEEMGLLYDVIVTSKYDGSSMTMPERKVDCHNIVEMQQYRVTGLVPFTVYNVTVISRSLHFSGQARSVGAATCQSRPLKAPIVVGWSSSSATLGDVAVFWTRYRHEEKGGRIIAYNATVTDSVTTETFSDITSVEGQQLVTFPRVLKGCRRGCVVTLTAATSIGSSPPANVTIPTTFASQRVPVVHNEISDNKTRTVSWKGSVNVTSVAWCFGAPFSPATPIIHCKTELREKAVDLSDTQRMVIDEKDLAAEDGESTKLCEGCDWHFALRVSSAGSDTSRLVWGLYRQDVDGTLQYDSHYVAIYICLTLILTLTPCILSVRWCVRRWKRKAKQFSALDFSYHGSCQENIGGEKYGVLPSVEAPSTILQETTLTAAPNQAPLTSRDSADNASSDRTCQISRSDPSHNNYVMAASTSCSSPFSEAQVKERPISSEETAEMDRLLGPEAVTIDQSGLNTVVFSSSKVFGSTVSDAAEGEMPRLDGIPSMLGEEIQVDSSGFASGHREVYVEKPEPCLESKPEVSMDPLPPLTVRKSNGYVKMTELGLVQSQTLSEVGDVNPQGGIEAYVTVVNICFNDTEGKNHESKCLGQKGEVCVKEKRTALADSTGVVYTFPICPRK